VSDRVEGFTIRPLGPDDAEAYRALRLRGLAEHPDAFTSSAEEESAKSIAAMGERLAPAANGPRVVVFGALEDGRLVGLVGLEVDRRIKVRHRGYVFGMYVPAERSGRGLGRALLETLIAHATREGLAQLVLTVTATNAHARTLYERAGFGAFGCEPDAVIVAGKAYDKLHMIRFLPGR
jgi:ribosomal protein S18 acetylase RimI-like enzyme